MIINLTLPHEYEIEVGADLPSGPGVITQLDIGENSFRSGGLVVKVTPEAGVPWITTFIGGSFGVDAVYSTPNTCVLCVISAGNGYFVEVNNPSEWKEVDEVSPITDSKLIPEIPLLLFSDFNSMVAYGKNGLVWSASELVTDYLEIDEATPEAICCTGYDPWEKGDTKIILDPKTGAVIERTVIPQEKPERKK
ncbi:MAG: hypothetical protein WCO51_08405 [bacterium]